MLYLFRLLRNNLFGVISTLLFLFGYWQVLRFNSYQSSLYFNTSSTVTSSITETRESINSFFGLPGENEKLITQNKFLIEALSNQTPFSDSTAESYKKQYEVTIAKIINGSTRNTNNIFTINRGKKHGILKGEGVIGPEGVVGIVIDVNSNFAIVMPLINSKFTITPEIEELKFANGVISWDGQNTRFLKLSGISKFRPLKKGMDLITSHYSKRFPSGIKIGSIHSLKKEDNSSFFNITVRTATDFHSLNYVYIIKNNYIPFIDSLNQQITEPDAY
jgi:rod shape-determining protein MreC